MTWQPIDTAPKDGTSILTYPHYSVIHWSNEGDVLTATGNGWASTWCDDLDAFSTCDPTHWMPLPASPEAE